MRAIRLMTSAVVLIAIINSSSYCQKISTIESFGEQAEKLWEVTIPITPNRNDLSGVVYALLKTGIAVLSPDGKTIYCYDYNNGQLKWQAPGIQIESSNGGLSSTNDGEYLYLAYPIHEDAFTSAVYNADGQLIWSATYDSPFEISPSGNYLISMYDGLDQSMPLMILDLASSNILWQINLTPPHLHWQAAVGRNDKIAYYNAGLLKLYDLKTGKMLWAKDVEMEPRGDIGEVHISYTGNVISYSNFVGKLGNEKRIIYIFNEDGELLWRRVQPFIPGKTNGGIVGGISEEGELININDIGEFSIYEIKNHKKLWTITDNPPSGITMFTKDFIAFFPWKEGTRIITLNDDGTIKHDHRLNQLIDFRHEKQGRYFADVQKVLDITPILVKKISGKLALSKFNLMLRLDQ
jgi:hypothetical protein